MLTTQESPLQNRPVAGARRDTQPVRATPVPFIHAILHAYVMRGLCPDDALAHAQITPEELRDPDGFVTAGQVERLSAYAMNELDDEALGIFSQPMGWGSYGMLARASLSSPDLRVALKRWCRHYGLLTRDVSLEVQCPPRPPGRWPSTSVPGRAWATVTLHEHRPLAAQVRVFGLVSVLRNLLGIACWLLDSQIVLDEVSLPFERPSFGSELGLMFAGPIRYGAPRASIRFDAAYLDMPVRRTEEALNQMLKRPLLVVIKPYRRDRLVRHRVQQLLQASDRGEGQTAVAIAEALHVSVRSLHRFLKEDGTSLQAIKDEVREARARQLLIRTRDPVKKVAGRVGFDNARSFARAFTSWTGMTPQQFRLRHGRFPAVDGGTAGASSGMAGHEPGTGTGSGSGSGSGDEAVAGGAGDGHDDGLPRRAGGVGRFFTKGSGHEGRKERGDDDNERGDDDNERGDDDDEDR